MRLSHTQNDQKTCVLVVWFVKGAIKPKVFKLKFLKIQARSR